MSENPVSTSNQSSAIVLNSWASSPFPLGFLFSRSTCEPQRRGNKSLGIWEGSESCCCSLGWFAKVAVGKSGYHSQSRLSKLRSGNADKTAIGSPQECSEMALMVEYILVVIRKATLDANYQGGEKQFRTDWPMAATLADDDLISIGFIPEMEGLARRLPFQARDGFWWRY